MQVVWWRADVELGCGVCRNFYTCIRILETIEIQARSHSQEFFMSSLSRSAKMYQPFFQSTFR